QGVTVTYLNPGQTVADRGTRDEMIYVIAAGEIVATTIGEGPASELRAFGSGQVIGESTLFEHKPWPATYKAKAKSTLLKLTQAGLQVCLTGNPDPRGFLDVLRREEKESDGAQLRAPRRECAPA